MEEVRLTWTDERNRPFDPQKDEQLAQVFWNGRCYQLHYRYSLVGDLWNFSWSLWEGTERVGKLNATKSSSGDLIIDRELWHDAFVWAEGVILSPMARLKLSLAE